MGRQNDLLTIGGPEYLNIFMKRLIPGHGSNPAHGDAKRKAQLSKAPRFSPYRYIGNADSPVFCLQSSVSVEYAPERYLSLG